MNLLRKKFFVVYTNTMFGIFQRFLLFLSASSIYGMMVSNPAQPALFEQGLWLKSRSLSLRIGYLDDWVYKQRFKQEFLIAEKTHSKNKLSTYAGIITLNLLKRLDLYGYLGTSRFEIDNQIFSRSSFAWCAGGKLVFLKHKNFFWGLDVKYFETDQNPKFFVIQGLPYNLVNSFTFKYYDLQGALGFAYRCGLFSPYINATYIYSHLAPEPPIVLVRFPDINEIADIEIPSLISRKRWGMSIGFSLVDLAKATLAFEWRVFNQNAVNFNGEIRF